MQVRLHLSQHELLLYEQTKITVSRVPLHELPTYVVIWTSCPPTGPHKSSSSALKNANWTDQSLQSKLDCFPFPLSNGSRTARVTFNQCRGIKQRIHALGNSEPLTKSAKWNNQSPNSTNITHFHWPNTRHLKIPISFVGKLLEIELSPRSPNFHSTRAPPIDTPGISLFPTFHNQHPRRKVVTAGLNHGYDSIFDR